MIWLALQLGGRAATSASGRARSLAFVLVGAIACLCLAVVPAADRTATREIDRTARISLEGLPADAVVNAINVSRYRNRLVTLVTVPSDAPTPSLPAGLTAPLPPGTVRLSPGLSEAVGDDPILRSWFPQERLGDLPRAAVGTAGEYKAYVGGPVAGITAGAAPGLYPEQPEFNRYQRMGFIAFSALPAIGLLVLTSRFGRPARRARFAALRLLGVPSTTGRAVGALEVAAPLLLGALGAALLVPIALPERITIPFVERLVFGADLQLPAATWVTIVAIVTGMGAVAGASTGRQGATGRIATWVDRGDPARRWSLLLYLVGVGCLLVALFRALPRDPLRDWGIVASGLGLMGAITFASQMAGRALGINRAPVWWSLAMRKLSADPRTHARLAGVAGILVFAAGLGQSANDILAHPSSTWQTEARAAGATTVAGWSQAVPGARLAPAVDRPPGTLAYLTEIAVTGSGGRSRAVVGTCADLEDLTQSDLGCDVAPVVAINDTASDGEPLPGSPDGAESGPVVVTSGTREQGGGTVRLDDVASGGTIRYDPDLPIDAQRLGIDFPDLFISKEALPPDLQPVVTGYYVRTEATDEAWERARAWLIATSPTAHIENPFEARAEHDTSTQWFLIGLGLVGTLGLIGTLLSIIEERRSAGEWFALRALGLSATELVAMRAAIGATAALAGTLVATYPAIIVTLAVREVIGADRSMSLRPHILIGAASIIAVIAVSVASGLLQLRHLNRRTSP